MMLLKLTAVDLARNAYSTLRWKENTGSSLTISYGSGSESTESNDEKPFRGENAATASRKRSCKLVLKQVCARWHQSMQGRTGEWLWFLKSAIICPGTCSRLILFSKSLYLFIFPDCCARLSGIYKPTTGRKSVKLKGELRPITVRWFKFFFNQN